jgi:hypothetical protein
MRRLVLSHYLLLGVVKKRSSNHLAHGRTYMEFRDENPIAERYEHIKVSRPSVFQESCGAAHLEFAVGRRI